jgi:hypothetical protein
MSVRREELIKEGVPGLRRGGGPDALRQQRIIVAYILAQNEGKAAPQVKHK